MTTRERILLAAHALDGALYRWGGSTPRDGGLDCSGYVGWVYHCAGVPGWEAYPSPTTRLTAEGLRATLRPITAPEVQPGDLVFYGVPARASHVVIVESVAPGTPPRIAIIGSSRGDSGVTTWLAAQTRRAWVQRRESHLYRADCIGFGRAPG